MCLLGNDVVVIVFKEGQNESFNPAIINSQFNRKYCQNVLTVKDVFIVVQPEHDGTYRVSIVNKYGVRQYGKLGARL